VVNKAIGKRIDQSYNPLAHQSQVELLQVPPKQTTNQQRGSDHNFKQGKVITQHYAQ